MNNEEIKDIVERLQRLQIEQSSLIDRLSRATEDRPNVIYNEPATRTTIPIDTTAPRSFVIGDRVSVLNPGLLQQNIGNVFKITRSNRIYVRTDNGNTLWRASKNLSLLG
jgi:hypothetical protein